MKIIDLLNKIANDDIPKSIKYDGYIYQWNNNIKNYEREIDIGITLNWDYIVIECLNEEVEIIEEDKKIEKLILDDLIDTDEVIYDNFHNIELKINEIIDYLMEEK